MNSNHHLAEFFPRFGGGENGQPSAQRAKGALIPATIKSIRRKFCTTNMHFAMHSHSQPKAKVLTRKETAGQNLRSATCVYRQRVSCCVSGALIFTEKRIAELRSSSHVVTSGISPLRLMLRLSFLSILHTIFSSRHSKFDHLVSSIFELRNFQSIFFRKKSVCRKYEVVGIVPGCMSRRNLSPR